MGGRRLCPKIGFLSSGVLFMSYPSSDGDGERQVTSIALFSSHSYYLEVDVILILFNLLLSPPPVDENNIIILPK